MASRQANRFIAILVTRGVRGLPGLCLKGTGKSVSHVRCPLPLPPAGEGWGGGAFGADRSGLRSAPIPTFPRKREKGQEQSALTWAITKTKKAPRKEGLSYG
ncbi:hypothetical protein GCM10007235_15930 [Pseudoxanthomonas indica]|nr:hypothetical protein GCM10007235_15930 [Pseudoxanthomonas indica]